MLAKLGLTPQKPLKRAYQRDAQAIERWKREYYPGIAEQAKARQAEIAFWDESGFRADTVQGRTWALKGRTPEVKVPGQRQSVSAASAVNARGAFWFVTHQGEQLQQRIKADLRAVQQNPKLVRSFFKAPSVA